MPTIKGYSITDIGSREENQDSMLMLTSKGERAYLAAIADGAGGADEGLTASKGLLAEIGKWFAELPEKTWDEKSGKIMNELDAKLKGIHEAMKAYANTKGITFGTTLTLLLIINEKFYLAAQVGDSRLYLYQDGTLTQITKDQTVAQKERDTGGEISCTTDKESTLLQCFGSGKVAPKYYDGTLGDTAEFLLCSDGLTNTLELAEIEDALKSGKEGSEKLDTLMRIARNRLEQDNITAITIKKSA